MRKISLAVVKKRLQKVHGKRVQIVDSTYVAVNSKATFIDVDYGEWSSIVSMVLQGRRHTLNMHANRSCLRPYSDDIKAMYTGQRGNVAAIHEWLVEHGITVQYGTVKRFVSSLKQKRTCSVCMQKYTSAKYSVRCASCESMAHHFDEIKRMYVDELIDVQTIANKFNDTPEHVRARILSMNITRACAFCKNEMPLEMHANRRYCKTCFPSHEWLGLLSYQLNKPMFDEMLASQQGMCPICQRTLSSSSKRRLINVDHDHKTGKVRGLLCAQCNVYLGFLETNIGSLDRALAYLGRTMV